VKHRHGSAYHPIEAEVQVVREVEEYLRKIEERLRAEGFNVENHVRYGDEAEEILDMFRAHARPLPLRGGGDKGCLSPKSVVYCLIADSFTVFLVIPAPNGYKYERGQKWSINTRIV